MDYIDLHVRCMIIQVLKDKEDSKFWMLWNTNIS